MYRIKSGLRHPQRPVYRKHPCFIKILGVPMPKVTIKTDNKTIDVKDGYPLIDMCEDHDTSILFGCRDGACGACMIRVLEGEQFISKMQDNERDFLETMAAAPNERLACQCKVTGGNIVIEVSE